MAKIKHRAGPASTVAKAEAPAAPGGFSLGTLEVGAPGGGFSLDAAPQRKGPITAPLPTGAVPGAPLAVQDEADAELAALHEQFTHPKLSAAEFKAKKDREHWRRNLAAESTYWCALVFANTEDMNVFLSQLNVPIEGQYLDGYEVAARLGFVVPRSGLPEPRMSPLDMWADLALEVPEAEAPSVPEDFDDEFE